MTDIVGLDNGEKALGLEWTAHSARQVRTARADERGYLETSGRVGVWPDSV